MAIVILKNVRLSFPDLWKPGAPMQEGDTPKFGGQFIFAKGSEAEIAAKAAMTEAAKTVFGANWQAIVTAMEGSKKCLRNGDSALDKSGAVRNGYAGNVYIVARNKARPAIVGGKDKGTGQFIQLTEDGGKPYGGCYVNAKVDIQAMLAKGKMSNQIYARLLAVQFVGDGEAFGAAPGTADGFEDVEYADADAGGSAFD